MRKVQLTAVFWTLLLAIPFTALALAATAYLTDNLTEIASTISYLIGDSLANARDLVFEAELVGLIAGQALILVVLLVTYLARPKEETDS
jgi:hypothetical protein